MRTTRALRGLVVLGALAALASSCAYYNTYYLARKNYFKGTDGAPYVVDKAQAMQAQYFNKAIDYSKKLLAEYPRSKWVDDAYVLWAKALLGQSDPLQTVSMLSDFTTRYPDSPLRGEATFYLGVAYRQARRYSESLRALDDFIAKSPRHDLVPYAQLERARVLMALQRPGDAAAAAGVVLERFPKSALAVEARKARAEAYYSRGDFAKARDDYRFLGEHSLTEEDRLGWLLREADCLEGARDFDGSIALLKDAISHETEPQPPTPPAGTTGAGGTGAASTFVASSVLSTPGADHYGRLLMRIGTANLLAGRVEPALQAYRDVLRDYPRTTLGAEAQYRIGYAYETAADDFDQARTEYAKVKDQGTAGGYSEQAAQRLSTLDRLAQFKTAGGDSIEKRAEAAFVRAEVYLFQLDKPDRALQEYQKAAADLKGTPYEPKALNAQAWVLSRKLERNAEADSLFWAVVRQHPATEAQLAARDYLEAEGAEVPQDLIRMPVRLLARADTTHLTAPPPEDLRLGARGPLTALDSARTAPMWQNAIFGSPMGAGVRPDSLGRMGPPSFAGPGLRGGPFMQPGAPLDSSALAGAARRPAGGPGLAGAVPDSVVADSLALARTPLGPAGGPRLAGAARDTAAGDSVVHRPRFTPKQKGRARRLDVRAAAPDSTQRKPGAAPAAADSTRGLRSHARADSTGGNGNAAPAAGDSTSAPHPPAVRDSARGAEVPATPDTTRKRP